MSNIDALLIQIIVDNKTKIKSDVLSLITQFKTLNPKIGSLIHNDGTETKNLCLGGTIPIYFQNVQYNIPVDIYLSTSHPQVAPTVFVRPTSNMIVKPGHSCVEMDGSVKLDYLTNWSTPYRANVNELVQMMSSAFSCEPPLFTRPPGYALNQPILTPGPSSTNAVYANNLNNTPIVQATVISNTANTSSSSNFRNSNNDYIPVINGVVLNNYVHTGTVTTSTPSSSGAVGTGSGNSSGKPVSREQLEDDVTMKLHLELYTISSKLKKEIDEEFLMQNQLSISYERVLTTCSLLNKKKADMSESLLELERQTRVLESWNKEKMNFLEQTLPDYTSSTYIESYDTISNQLILLKSKMKTYNDMIYYLEKAQQNGHIDIKDSLKEIRKLSKEEFLCRLHINKINSIVSEQIVNVNGSTGTNNGFSNYHTYAEEKEYNYMNTNSTPLTRSKSNSNVSLNTLERESQKPSPLKPMRKLSNASVK